MKVLSFFMSTPTYPQYIEMAQQSVHSPDVQLVRNIRQMHPKIRFALLTSCQSGCDFCHLEGEKQLYEIGTLNPALAGWKQKTCGSLLERLDGAVSVMDVEKVIDFAHHIGANAIHLTGGEPTLHPQICDFIKMIKRECLRVTVTTHGEIGSDILNRMIDSGIDSLNFSMHVMEPDQYLAMDMVAQEKQRKYGINNAMKYAAGRLQLKKDAIESAKAHCDIHGYPIVKINSVVRDAIQSIQILHWSEGHGIDCRFQKNLNEKAQSDIIISEIIKLLQAKLSGVVSSNGDSTRSSLTFSYPAGILNEHEYEAGRFTVKEERIRQVFFDPMCDNCILKDTNRCRERFYGVRINNSEGRLCMDVQNPFSNFDLHNPCSNFLVEQIKKHYDNSVIEEIFIH